MIQLRGIDHCTIRARPQDVDAIRDFYGDVLGLRSGRRPSFSFPGHWMYLDETAVVHIAGTLDPAGPAAPAGAPGSTGRFDHVSFRADGLEATQAHLRARGVAFQGTPVPGTDLYQLFFYDPAGVKVELTFYGVGQRTDEGKGRQGADAAEADTA